MLVWGRTALPAFMAATLAASAGAQQKACEIDEGSPNQIARAMLSLQVAQNSQKPEEAAKQLQNAIKVLAEADKTKNPVGRNMVMGRTLVLWMGQPSMSSGFATRGALGFVDGADGAVRHRGRHRLGLQRRRSVESGMRRADGTVAPAEGVGRSRESRRGVGQYAREERLRRSVAAKRSLVLYKSAPYAYIVLAKVSAEKNQPKDAIGYYKQAITVRRTRRWPTRAAAYSRQLGAYAADLSEVATGADKAAIRGRSQGGIRGARQRIPAPSSRTRPATDRRASPRCPATRRRSRHRTPTSSRIPARSRTTRS